MDARGEVRITVKVGNGALRRGLDLVERGAAESLDALVDDLLLNGGLSADGSPQPPPAAHFGRPGLSDSLLTRPEGPPAAALMPDPGRTQGALLFLTNRMSPLKLSARVLANLQRHGEWPELREFHLAAARAARAVGMRLRAEDKEAGRRGAGKRFVGYPVGDDQEAAFDRYTFSFTLDEVGGHAAGPLAVLGLADVVDGRAVLTEAGWHLACAESPLLEAGEGLVARDEIDIFRKRLRAAADEHTAVQEFIVAVRRAAGSQTRVDQLLATWHSDWSSDRAAAHRAAMLGRLGELRLLRVTGRGSRAQIDLLDTDEFAPEKGSTE